MTVATTLVAAVMGSAVTWVGLSLVSWLWFCRGQYFSWRIFLGPKWAIVHSKWIKR